MVEPFSTNDVYYVNAETDPQNATNNEKNYKDGVDKLNALKQSYQLTEKQNADLNTSQDALILNNITLGIGILGMMWVMYKS
jgi:hypothetical protein